MPPVCTICTHPKRSESDKALITGTPFRTIANRTGTSLAALKRHKDSHLGKALAEAQRKIDRNIARVVEHEAERQATAALDVHAELGNVFDRMKKLLDACDTWLTDPDDSSRYDLNPRAHELQVTYEYLDGYNERGRPIYKRRKQPLSDLLAKIEKEHPKQPSIVMVESKSADPRDLIVKTANALRPSVELLAKLVGALDESPKNVTQIQINAIEVVRSA